MYLASRASRDVWLWVEFVLRLALLRLGPRPRRRASLGFGLGLGLGHGNRLAVEAAASRRLEVDAHHEQLDAAEWHTQLGAQIASVGIVVLHLKEHRR